MPNFFDASTENWTYEAIATYYHSQDDTRRVFDRIKKDLTQRANEIDEGARLAQEFLSDWKGLVANLKNLFAVEEIRRKATAAAFADGAASMSKARKKILDDIDTVVSGDNGPEDSTDNQEKNQNKFERTPLGNRTDDSEDNDAGNDSIAYNTEETLPNTEREDEYHRKMSESDYEKYKEVHGKMDVTKKWELSTGTIVEDALYYFGLQCNHEHLAHSFVLDPDDNTYITEKVFTKSELDEIRCFNAKELPQMPMDLLKYLSSFDVKSIPELRKKVFQPQDMDCNFDRANDFDKDWIRNTVYNLLLEYEADTLSSNHLELWLLVNVWRFIDKVFGNVGGLEAVRGESCSISSSRRKNRESKNEAKDVGRRGDLLLRKFITEFGCGEAGHLFEGESGTKLMKERGLKMPKMMKDIFDQLCAAVDHDEQKIRQLETIGFLHAGLMVTFLRLDSPAGYVCRVSRSKLLSIASQMPEFGKRTLPVITLAWKAKAIVVNTIRLIEQTDDALDDHDNEESRLRRLQDACENSPPPLPKRPRLHLPICLDTPLKKVKAIQTDRTLPPPPFPKAHVCRTQGSADCDDFWY